MTFEIYTTDSGASISGGNIEKGEWATFTAASSTDRRKSASYAVGEAVDAAVSTAKALAREQGCKIVAYSGTEPAIQDDGRIAAAIEQIRTAVEARARKLAGQAPAPQFPCAGARDGCGARVQVRGAFCPRCAHDEE
jgi:hypothetical protein